MDQGTGQHAAYFAPELPHLDVETCVRYTLTIDPDVARFAAATMCAGV